MDQTYERTILAEMKCKIKIKSLKNGKAAGIDEIQPEALKAGGNGHRIYVQTTE